MRAWSFTLAAVSAALLTVAWRPWGSGYVAWIALVPLLLALHDETRWWRGALLAWIAWLGIGTVVFEGVSPVLPWAYPILTISTAGWWAAAGAIYSLVTKQFGTTTALLSFPVVVAALEFLASRRVLFGDLANGIGMFGYSQFDTPVRAAAGWSGLSGIGLAVLAINVAIVMAVKQRKPMVALLPAALFIAILAMPVPGQSVPHPSQQLERVAIVQGAASEADRLMARFDETAASRLLETYAQLSREATEEGATLLVWGETVLPKAVRELEPSEPASRALSFGRNVLVGGREEWNGAWYNSALLWNEGRLATAYRKHSLVPLIEDGYTPGARQQPPVEIEGMRWGIAICLDSLFGSLARESTAAGADALVYLTDDTFGGLTVTPEIHLRATAFRAAETGRQVLFANEAGPSAFFDTRGSVLGKTDNGTATVLLSPVQAHVGLTPFVRFGDWVGLTAMIIVGALVSFMLASGLPKRAPAGAPSAAQR